MSEPSLIGRQRTVLHDLAEVAADKARVEPALARSFHAEMERAEQEHEQASTTLRQRRTRERETLDAELEQTQEAIEAHFAAEQDIAQKEHGKSRWEFSSRLENDKEAADTSFQEACWAADALLESAKGDARIALAENNARLAARIEELEGLREQARALVKRWGQPAGDIEDDAAERSRSQKRKLRKITECIEEVQEHLEELDDLTVPRYRGKRLFFLLVLLWVALIFPLGWLVARFLQLPPSLLSLLGLGAAASTVVSVMAAIVAYPVLAAIARRQVEAAYRPLYEVVLEAEATQQHLLDRYQAEHDQAVVDAQQRHQKDLARAQARQQQKLADLNQRRSTGLAPIEARLQAIRDVSEQRRANELQAAQQRHKQGRTQSDQQFESSLQQLDSRHQSRLEEIYLRHLQQWQTHVARWQRLLEDSRRAVADIVARTDDLYPPWDRPFWRDWQPPVSDRARPDGVGPPPVMRVGSYSIRTESVVEALPWSENRPAPQTIDHVLPLLCPFPEPRSILYHAHDEGRDRAVESLQTVMFRLLTSLPPGRVRFLIVDPVGLGQNFAAFMNLADHDETLVSSRIWTEAVHIEHRLADLTAHMENVIQKYLRNKYPTISDYNTHAGEVAEPFRVLVVANFPTNFTAEAIRRLVSITQGGPRCGVSTLISIDTRQQLPKGFDLADLERCGVNMDWDDRTFRCRDQDLGRHPVTIDRLPDDEFCNRILQKVGEAARGAHRVEVPFDFIAPVKEQWWNGSTRGGISVALGRAGATRRQNLELGKGTSQHALVAGKTGSGKSTLLHALITNLALLYSPDEVELYLIDFKKGVEFKTYAVHELPHARVVAIESEREFGLSVLERLDTELKLRGERFRAVGAQDLASFRQADPRARSPRIMLIVDEFQEFFVEDDRLAQEAARLLDRLVRQGRAFGMHVLLGSQTLGGAYSLARSTIDQMAVRIALQCSEADAHLILSDDNSAARLLSRPGEAIYNDANGLVEGNDPFQVVWLGDEQREQYLERIRELTRQRPMKERPPMVVFEGNAVADASKNPELNRLLATIPGARGEPVERAWLGDAMAIDELTSADFRRQNGSNLLILGQQPESALGMLTVGVVGLAAHAPPAPSRTEGTMTRFWIVDGHQADAPRSGPLARLPEVLPEPVRLGGWRDLPAILSDLTAELDRRQSAPNAEVPAIYLVLYGLQRMRDLRRQEDDFGFGSRGDDRPATPDKQLGLLLREGSALGMHVLLWCDTLGNLQRAFDRQAMRELSMRVAFQMSVTDSSNLIDSPAASKLGSHRALFANEEDGRLEKFRPYGIPADSWLSDVREAFRRRGETAEVAAGS